LSKERRIRDMWIDHVAKVHGIKVSVNCSDKLAKRLEERSFWLWLGKDSCIAMDYKEAERLCDELGFAIREYHDKMGEALLTK